MIAEFTSWVTGTYLKHIDEELRRLLGELGYGDRQAMACHAGTGGAPSHVALPAIRGLLGGDDAKDGSEGHEGAVCGTCALRMLATRSPQAVARAHRMRRDFRLEVNITKMLEDRGIAQKLAAVGLDRQLFELQYNRIVEAANKCRVNRGGGANKASAAKRTPTPKTTTNDDTHDAVIDMARQARLSPDEIVFAVEHVPSGQACAACAASIGDALAFGVVRGGRGQQGGTWMHLGCVDARVRGRALTEGVRGWAGMGADGRRAVLRGLVGGESNPSAGNGGAVGVQGQGP